MKEKINWDEVKDKYSSVIYVDIPEDEPVLIFKSWGNCFLNEAEVPIEGSLDSISIITADFLSIWKQDVYKRSIPKIVDRYYPKIFKKLKQKNFFYNQDDLPAGVFELRIDLVTKSGLFDFNQEQFKLIKECFKDFGLLEEKRGKIKKKTNIRRIRDNHFKQICEKLNISKTIPIKFLQDSWNEKLCDLFPKNPTEVEKHQISDATVRRIVRSCINK